MINMNKKILIALALMIFISMNTASAGLFDIAEDALQSTENNDTTLVVGFNPIFPPFEYLTDNGSYTGFDLDLAKEVCARNNWTFEAKPLIDWNSKEFEINSGEIDCIWSSFTIDGREDKYTFSEPYFNNTQVVVVNSNSDIKTLDDLNGKTVEVQEGSSVIDGLNNNTTLKNSLKDIVEVRDITIAFMDLKSGVCDAILVDREIANYHINTQHPEDKVLNESISYEKYGIGFKNGNTELRDQVQKTLDEMFKDGTVEKLAQKYSDYDIEKGLINPST